MRVDASDLEATHQTKQQKGSILFVGGAHDDLAVLVVHGHAVRLWRERQVANSPLEVELRVLAQELRLAPHTHGAPGGSGPSASTRVGPHTHARCGSLVGPCGGGSDAHVVAALPDHRRLRVELLRGDAHLVLTPSIHPCPVVALGQTVWAGHRPGRVRCAREAHSGSWRAGRARTTHGDSLPSTVRPRLLRTARFHRGPIHGSLASQWPG